MTAHPAEVLGLRDRGRLVAGHFADIVVFDPATIQDHATYVDPHRYATGVSHVIVNGEIALADGEPTDARPGRFVRGRGWTGWDDGGCRETAGDWERP
jgi:N-acyl-D-amino-acid deacylase